MAAVLLSGCVTSDIMDSEYHLPDRACRSYDNDWFERGFTRMPACSMNVYACMKECESRSSAGEGLSSPACIMDGVRYNNFTQRDWACAVGDGSTCSLYQSGEAENLILLDEECDPVDVTYDLEVVTAYADGSEYRFGDELTVTVLNLEPEKVCLGSCNTIYYQRKIGAAWDDYMVTCIANFISDCIEPGDSRGLAQTLVKVGDMGEGTYRVAVPVYYGCPDDEMPCEEMKIKYTGEFKIV
ncbi:MAG: hypothetical protein GF416_08900 [Candidatus Altiarchaeales archaeon]|nr:hypothetical protein [Candidatus Altiarchaeales archaeon]MBD3417235.1 hypothetical protein [Candidatus Altiarchaeales archaeon]